MNPLPIQILLTALGCIAAFRLIKGGAGGSANIRRAVWILPFFAGATTIIWNPELTTGFAHLVGVNRGVDAVVYLSVALLLLLVIRLYVSLEKQDQVITRLVSELALNDGFRNDNASSRGKLLK